MVSATALYPCWLERIEQTLGSWVRLREVLSPAYRCYIHRREQTPEAVAGSFDTADQKPSRSRKPDASTKVPQLPHQDTRRIARQSSVPRQESPPVGR